MLVPPAAYGPWRKLAMGMNCSFWATAGADRPSATSSAAIPDHPLVLISPCLSMGKRPQTQLFLRDLPQPCEPVRLDDEKEDDERPEADQLQLAQQPGTQLAPHEQMQSPVQEEREEEDE